MSAPDPTPYLRPGVDLVTAEDVARWMLRDLGLCLDQGEVYDALRARLDRERRQVGQGRRRRRVGLPRPGGRPVSAPSALGALRLYDPAAWARRVRSAMKAHKGRIADAARALEVSPRTLLRWLADPSLADVPRHPAGVPYGPRRRALATTPAPGDESAS